MHYATGQLSLDHYLNDPFVHPHAIIFFLFLVDYLTRGQMLIPHFATIFSIILLVAMFWYVTYKMYAGKIELDIRICAFIFSLPILYTGYSEATAIPFQAVVTVSRFVYAALLTTLVYGLFKRNTIVHATALVLSCIAISFYASAGIFAAEIILLHILFFRRWKWLLASFLPLLAYLLLVNHYFFATAESKNIKAILDGMNIVTIGQLGLGTICYYASSVVAGWPTPTAMQLGVSEILQVLVGFVVLACTVIWSGIVLSKTFMKSFRGNPVWTRLEAVSCLMALISLWVFVSGAAAALLWVARAKIAQPAGLGMPVHYMVLTSSRYAAFAELSFMVFMFILMTMRNKKFGQVLSLISFAVIAGLGYYSSMENIYQDRYVAQRNRIEGAATAILMGINPAAPEAEQVWPGVHVDWYWPTELPKVAAFLRSHNMSYAHDLPVLGQKMSTVSAPINTDATSPVAGSPEVCRIAGNADLQFSQSLIAPRRFFPITDSNHVVVGFALYVGNHVAGHALCKAVADHQPVNLSAVD